MTHQIFTEVAASISERKANPMKVFASGEGIPIAILNRRGVVAKEKGCVMKVGATADTAVPASPFHPARNLLP